MAFSRATKNLNVASRGAAYGMPAIAVDGNDVLEVYQAAGEAIDRARSGGGPTLLECKTYRIVGHHEGDPGTDYRTRDEVESWKKRCPLSILRERALNASWASVSDFEKIALDVQAWLDDAVEFSRTSPNPDPATVMNHVFCSEDGQ
jgi:2-oxoisovalerate dehydrogenase E1 component